MKKLTFALATFAPPLAAHEGAHVHPHGNDPFWAVAVLSLAIVILAAAVLRRK
ncbi:MAG: peptidase M23 [Roseovarius sp.]|uniref:peptidase M23 n=1 Tax=Roseovarius sp. TaxID=1486281 RepID=UPI004059E4E7